MAETEPISSTETDATESMSLGNRLVNIFVSPAEVFDDVKTGPPSAANWCLPLALVVIIAIVYSMVVFSQPGIIQGMREVQEKKMQEQVQQGKITQQQADAATAMVDKVMGPTFMKISGIISSVILLPILLFLEAGILWLVGTKIFHREFSYMKAAEVVGLSFMISCVQMVIAMLLAVIYGNLAMTPGPALLVSHYDPANKVHALLSALDLLSLWYVAIVALGLSRLSGAGYLKSAMWTFGFWAVLRLGPVLIFVGR